MKIVLTFLLCVIAFQAKAVTLLWTPATGTVDGYIVEESTDNGNIWTVNQELQNPTPNADGYIEASVATPETLTIYRIKAFNQNGLALLENTIVGYDPSVPDNLPAWNMDTKAGVSP